MKLTTSQILEQCKSSIRLTDPLEIRNHLSDAATKRMEEGNDSTYRFLASATDNSFQVQKVSGSMDLTMSFSKEELQAIAQRRDIPWDDAYTDRFLASYGSDERVDSHGDIVLQNWIFEQFETNPAMPFNHQWDGMALGAHVDWKVVTRADTQYSGPALWLLSLHATAEQYPFADFVYRMRKANFLRANSVGFYPTVVICINDEEERSKLGLGRWGDILDENILVENSPTLLGANSGALTILNSAKDAKLLHQADIIGLREINRQSLLASPDAWKEEDNKYRQLARALFPELEVEVHTDVEEPFDAARFLEISSGYKTAFNFRKTAEENKETEVVDPETEPDDEEMVEEKTLEELNQELGEAKEALEAKTIESTQILQRLVQLGAAFESITIAILSRFDSVEELILQGKEGRDSDESLLLSKNDSDTFSALDAFASAADSNSTN